MPVEPSAAVRDRVLFRAALGQTLLNEGSAYTNDAADRGGPTRFGITLATLRRFCGPEASPTDADVRALTITQAENIYYLLYWCPMRKVYAGYAQALTSALFDASVLCGLGRVVRACQEALSLKVDGIAGPKTKAAIAAAPPAWLVARLSEQLMAFFLKLTVKDATQLAFLKGWNGRVMRYATPVIT